MKHSKTSWEPIVRGSTDANTQRAVFGTLKVEAGWLTPFTVWAGTLTDPPTTRTWVPFMSTTEAVPDVIVKVDPEMLMLAGKLDFIVEEHPELRVKSMLADSVPVMFETE